MPTKDEHVEYYGDIDALLTDEDVRGFAETLVKFCKNNLEENMHAGKFPECFEDENPDMRRLAVICCYRDIHQVLMENGLGFDAWEFPMWRLLRVLEVAFTSDIYDQPVRDKLMSFLKETEARIA